MKINTFIFVVVRRNEPSEFLEIKMPRVLIFMCVCVCCYIYRGKKKTVINKYFFQIWNIPSYKVRIENKKKN